LVALSMRLDVRTVEQPVEWEKKPMTHLQLHPGLPLWV
jgi:hypothetical protein